MTAFFQPTLQAAKTLLTESDLPTADLTAGAMSNFLASGNAEQLDGVVGLEFHRPYGLLRSLAISVDARGSGLGRALVSATEKLAIANRIQALYLLTTTAADYFEGLGYLVVRRESAPPQIQHTAEFSSLCPDDAVVMMKQLAA